MAKVEILMITPDSEKLIEKCGRTCYKSEAKITDDSSKGFVRGIVKSGHHSVIEHAVVTFKVTECSRAFSHQAVRHRVASFSQESQRYCDEKGMFENGYYVTPKAINDMKSVLLSEVMNKESAERYSIIGITTVKQLYDSAIDGIDIMYQQLQEVIGNGIKKGLTKAKKNEDARYILPNACMTELVITMNFREALHFIKIRGERHAQWEIRDVAKQLHEMLNEEAPSVFGHIEWEKIEDGTFAIKE